MLVLSRKVGESIVINKNVTITITDIDNNKVRVGIVAPRNVPVDRLEVFEKKHPAETQSAGS